jgi:cytochrome P450
MASNPFSRAVRLRDGLPVLPGAFPLVGHIPAVVYGLPDLIRRAREQVGPVYWLTMGSSQWILVCTGPEAFELFKSKSFTSAHLPEMAPLVAGNSVLSQDGAAHRHLRSAMNGPFVPRGLSASKVGAMMAGALDERVARWIAQGKARVLPEVQEVALEIIFRMLGVDPGELPAWRVQYRALLLANLGIKVMFPGSPAHRAARAKAWIDARFRRLIAAARAAPDAEGLLAELARGKDDDGKGLDDEELLDNLRLLVLGGHETISATMSWIVIMLAARPDLWDALSAEAAQAPEVPTTPQAARAFPFAEGLFREAVRLHPPFGLITRVAVEPCTLHGKTIPVGTIIGIDLWSLGRDAALYPEPDDFRPARWLGRSGGPAPIEIAQFGAGPHFCLGYHLAWLEAVQLSVALARALGRAGKRPRLRGALPGPIFVPTEHPPAKTVVDLVPAGA